MTNKRRVTFIRVTLVVTVIMLLLLTFVQFIRILGSNLIDHTENVPRNLTIDEQDNIYVLTTSSGGVPHEHYQIEKLSRDGHYLARWGYYGAADGQLGDLLDPVTATTIPELAVDSQSDLFVVDQGNYRVQKFDTNGKFLTRWGSKGSGDGQFNFPVDIATDAEDNIYITDIVNSNVQKFDTNGKFLTRWGSKGSGDGQFNTPDSIAIDNNNIVYILDRNNYRIELFDTNGKYLTKWEGSSSNSPPNNSKQVADINLFQTSSLRVSAENKLYLVYGSVQQIFKMDTNGKIEKTLDYLVTPKDNMFDDTNTFGKMAVDKVGNIYIVKGYGLLSAGAGINDFDGYSREYYNPHVQKFDSNGHFLARFQPNVPPYEGLDWWAWLLAPLIGVIVGGLITIASTYRKQPKNPLT